MNTEIIVGIVGACTTVVSGWTTYFFTRKKYNTQVNGMAIENMQNTLKFYQDICESNRENLKVLTDQNLSLTKQVVDLQNQIVTLQSQVAELAVNICTDSGCSYRKRIRTRSSAPEKEEDTAASTPRKQSKKKVGGADDSKPGDDTAWQEAFK